MSSQDDIRAIDRFVAGLPVDHEELATALAARAIDRAIVVDAMLFALESDEDAVRLRAAKRSARMARTVVDPRHPGHLKDVWVCTWLERGLHVARERQTIS